MSAQTLTAQKALIFRIVHHRNLATLLDHGCLCRNDAQTGNYTDIGNLELIAKRKDRAIPHPPGGTLSDYVPFYFTPYSPMLYNIKTGYGVQQQPMADILIVISSLHHIAKCGIEFVYSDRHAYLKTAQFSNDLAQLKDRIAWSALQNRRFDKSDIDRFEKYQAEALIYKQVPLTAVLGIICQNDSVKDEVTKAAVGKGLSLKVINGPGWYL